LSGGLCARVQARSRRLEQRPELIVQGSSSNKIICVYEKFILIFFRVMRL